MYRQASRHFTNIKIGHYDRQGVHGSRKQAITEVLFPIGGLFRETYEKPAYVVCTPTGPLNVRDLFLKPEIRLWIMVYIVKIADSRNGTSAPVYV